MIQAVNAIMQSMVVAMSMRTCGSIMAQTIKLQGSKAKGTKAQKAVKAEMSAGQSQNYRDTIESMKRFLIDMGVIGVQYLTTKQILKMFKEFTEEID